MTARILVVDDEPDMEALVVQKFRHKIRDGTVTFLFAEDGADALAKLVENPDVDLVVSDIRMPRMDGLTLLEKLQDQEQRPATIIVTAYGDMDNIRTAMNRGAFDFLLKPIDLPDLEATIAKTIRHVEVLREAKQRQAEAERAYASLSRYFSPNLAEQLAGDSDAVDLGGRWQKIATLFTDIAGFTTLVETIEPSALAPLLNDYLAGMTDIVFAHEGTVTRIVGDALHILFGAPAKQPDYAERTVACALALDTYAQSFRQDWQKKGIKLGATRIGAHAGRAIVGNFGGDRFFDYTAHGDTINIAARLETANKHLGTRICISSDLAAKVADFKGRPIGDLVLRGRSKVLQAFEPLPADSYEDAATQNYLTAFAQLEAGDTGARASFAALVAAQPDDPLANFHLKRLLNGATGTRIELE